MGAMCFRRMPVFAQIFHHAASVSRAIYAHEKE